MSISRKLKVLGVRKKFNLINLRGKFLKIYYTKKIDFSHFFEIFTRKFAEIFLKNHKRIFLRIFRIKTSTKIFLSLKKIIHGIF